MTEQSDTPVIEVESLKKTFRVGFWRKKVEAVKEVSFSVHRNEILGLVGPNGAGKTTTMKAITGLITPDAGTVKLFGIPSDRVESRNKLGYLPENPYFYEHLSAEELLRFYGNLFGLRGSKLQSRIDELIEKVGLGYARDRQLKKFSKGMRQRAGLAQALINDPELVILDEPQSGLDPVGRKEVRDLIFELKKEGKTVLFSSHILPDVEAVCDRIVVIHKGENMETGTLSQLTGDRITHIELTVDAADVKQLEQLQDVSSVERRGDSYVLRFPGDIPTKDLLKRALAADLDVRSLERHREDLEAVFVRDTYAQDAKDANDAKEEEAEDE